MAWNLPVDILRSANFNFSGNWLAVYFANISASITIDGRCTPDHTTGLCEMDEVDSGRMNMSRTLGVLSLEPVVEGIKADGRIARITLLCSRIRAP